MPLNTSNLLTYFDLDSWRGGLSWPCLCLVYRSRSPEKNILLWTESEIEIGQTSSGDVKEKSTW